MRKYSRSSLPFLCLLVFSIPSLHAQFQNPTSDELKMTSDPKAPGAAAVYLSMDEVDNDPLHFQMTHVRIKVLQEKGKELATIHLPYLGHAYKITDIKGRTIHSDGKIFPLVTKAEDLLLTSDNGLQVRNRVFTLPNVEVGSILEYSWELRYDDGTLSSPEWEVQKDYFVHKSHYSFTPFKSFQPGYTNGTSSYVIDENGNPANTLIWWPILPAGAKVVPNLNGSYNADLTDIPALPNEDWAPPQDNYRYRIIFYYKSAHSPEQFWQEAAKRWSKNVDHFAEATPDLTAATKSLFADGDSDLEKARKIYVAVQALENTDFTRHKSEAELKQLQLKESRHAEDVWTRKSGDSEDIALLYLTMARAAGLNATALKIVNRAHHDFDISLLRTYQLEDTLVEVMIAGKPVLLDPGEKMCPFQEVSWHHSAAAGFHQNNEGKTAIMTQAQTYLANKTTRMADIDIQPDGSIKGTVKIILKGQQALYWRQYALRNDPDELKKAFDHSLESILPDGVEGHVDHFLALDTPDNNLMAIIPVQGQAGTTTARRMILPGFFFEARGRYPFVDQEKRQTPVDMHYAETITDQVTYFLPAGLTLEGAPKDTTEAWKDHAVLKIASKTSENKLVVGRSLARAFTFAKPAEYQDLRGFYEKYATANKQQVVLTLPATVGGN